MRGVDVTSIPGNAVAKVWSLAVQKVFEQHHPHPTLPLKGRVEAFAAFSTYF